MDASVFPMDPTTPSIPAFHLPQVKSDTPSRITLNRSSVATLEDHGPTSTNHIMGKRRKRMLKNCIECNTAHRRCVFESAGDLQCIRCNKFKLCCKFRYSGMCFICYDNFHSNYFLSVINVLHDLVFKFQNKVVAMTSLSNN